MKKGLQPVEKREIFAERFKTRGVERFLSLRVL